MVEFAETLPTEWVEARVQFVSERLNELSVEAVPDALLKEIMLNLLLLANAGDHPKVAEIFDEALRGARTTWSLFGIALRIGCWIKW
jgi:hypothetical protein